MSRGMATRTVQGLRAWAARRRSRGSSGGPSWSGRRHFRPVRLSATGLRQIRCRTRPRPGSHSTAACPLSIRPATTSPHNSRSRFQRWNVFSGAGGIGDCLHQLYANNPLHKTFAVIGTETGTWLFWDTITVAWLFDAGCVAAFLTTSPLRDDNLYWQHPNGRHPNLEAFDLNRGAIFHAFDQTRDRAPRLCACAWPATARSRTSRIANPSPCESGMPPFPFRNRSPSSGSCHASPDESTPVPGPGPAAVAGSCAPHSIARNLRPRARRLPRLISRQSSKLRPRSRGGRSGLSGSLLKRCASFDHAHRKDNLAFLHFRIGKPAFQELQRCGSDLAHGLPERGEIGEFPA